MNWNLEIPRIFHVYWGGTQLVYLRYLTVKSFMKLNPGWDVFLWYPKNPYKGRSWGNTGNDLIDPQKCKDYSAELMALPVSKVAIDFNNLGFVQNMAEVHKADYIRINALHLYGGVWSDMDIIYFKPIDHLEENIPENSNKETYVCVGSYGHSTGFNMASEKSRFFANLANMFNKEYKSNNYQCWGPDMFNKYYKRISDIPNAVNLSMGVVYAHDCHHASELINGSKARFNDHSIGCHW